jgi:hypothetical protein
MPNHDRHSLYPEDEELEQRNTQASEKSYLLPTLAAAALSDEEAFAISDYDPRVMIYIGIGCAVGYGAFGYVAQTSNLIV